MIPSVAKLVAISLAWAVNTGEFIPVVMGWCCRVRGSAMSPNYLITDYTQILKDKPNYTGKKVSVNMDSIIQQWRMNKQNNRAPQTYDMFMMMEQLREKKCIWINLIG